MNNFKDFSRDLDALAMNVEKDVDRYVTLLRRNGALPMTQPQVERPTTPEDAPMSSEPQKQTPRSRGKPAKPVRPADDGPRVALVNVTTRLTVETSERLTEAALRQRLAKKQPDNRQDIIGEALSEWFRRYGYGDGQ